jgi:kinetochore protein Spc24, fungi type
MHANSKAIQEMAPIIDPEEDYLTIVAAEERIATSEARRKKDLEDAYNNLKGERP